MNNLLDQEGERAAEGGVSNFVNKTKKEKSCCPSLSYKARIIGFIVCSLIGWAMSALSVVMIFVEPTLAAFAILYSLGNLTNIMSYVWYSFLELYSFLIVSEQGFWLVLGSN